MSEKRLTKSDLTDLLSERTELNTSKAKKSIDELAQIIIEELTRDDARKVSIRGFGTFDTKHRSARKGVDPNNPSEPIIIPERTVPVFRAGKRLKRSVRNAHSDSSSM